MAADPEKVVPCEGSEISTKCPQPNLRSGYLPQRKPGRALSPFYANIEKGQTTELEKTDRR